LVDRQLNDRPAPRRCSKIKETALSAGMRNPDRITPTAH
jgi:hypothetical protein